MQSRVPRSLPGPPKKTAELAPSRGGPPPGISGGQAQIFVEQPCRSVGLPMALPLLVREAMRPFLLVLLLGCTSHKGTTNEPVLTGDPCVLHTDEARCTADTACVWAGTCVSKSGGGGGEGSASCVCFNSDDVCFEQIG